jgi:hypothetical protein
MINFNRFLTKEFVFVFVVLLLCVNVSTALGAELHVPIVAGTQGDVVKVPVSVDKVDNLAGIKLALVYDRNILKFVKAEKTPYTANMLHVVNDRVPGKLIIVMAAAKGFAGEKAAIVNLTFELLKEVKKEDKITLQITEAELMNDKLQKIEVKLK